MTRLKRIQGDDDQYWELVRRVERLESSALPVRQFSANSVATVDLGAFDGDNVTGVRVIYHGYVTATGLGVSAPCLRPNGVTPVQVQALMQRDYWSGAAQAQDGVGGGNLANGNILVGYTDWTASGAWSNQVFGHGVLYTSKTGGQVRAYQGSYGNIDLTTNVQRTLHGRIYARWNDSTTTLTSLVFALSGGGTFTGRVSTETIR